MRATKHLPTLLCVLLAACGGETDTDTMDMAADTGAAETMAEPESPLAAFAGTWQATTYNEAGDSVAAYELMATDQATGWTLTFPGRDPLPVQVQPADGEVVTVVGPYESVLRAGVMVTTTVTSRVDGDRMSGTFRAVYQNAGADSVLTGTIEGRRIR